MIQIKEPDRLLTYFGVFLGALAVLYFGQEAILDLSPMVKSFLLVSASALFLTGSKKAGDRQTVLALYFFSAVSYLTFLVYYILRMNPSSNLVFLLLGASGAVFVIIGRNLSDYSPEPRKLKLFAYALIAVSLLVAVADTYAPEPAYTVQLEDDVMFGEHAGTVTVSNPYFLPQFYSVNLETCGDIRYTRVSPSNFGDTNGIVDGGAQLEINYTLRGAVHENQTRETYSLEHVETCGTPGNDTVQLVLREETD